jgi:hypothetical protein
VRDLTLYEELIRYGIAEAEARGSAIGHVTARRMAIWLLPRSQQEPDFMRGLIRFAKTGAVTSDLRSRLRHQARSPSHPNWPYAARLLQYAVARGADRGPVGADFGAVCDQIDQADAMLADLRQRVATTPRPRTPNRRGPGRQQPIAMARHDPASRTVSLILDEATANMAIHAIAVNAADREARTREVRQYAQTLPENSYGRQNRQHIAARETRIAARLRAIERAYRTALDPDAAPVPEPAQVLPATEKTPDGELELE